VPNIIIPDISRHVHFIPDSEDAGLMVRRGAQPLHAVVIFVLNERTVNLSITDHDGHFHTRIGITLVQPGDPLPGGSYCQWMPYQIASQAAAAPTKSDGGISPALADLIASTATSLTPEDLAGIGAQTEGDVSTTTESKA